VAGDHDMASAPRLGLALKQSLGEGRGIVVDLTETTFIDSSVIHVLFDTDSALAGQGKQLVLQIHTASIVMRALQISGLTSLPSASEREVALAIAATPRGERERDGDLL
jgi:anti-anti-sigma factor